ncbi:alpha/beta hydrolase family protein [Luteolibacter algae]|uniref:Alpha/beta hydrolase family protein n=1 Tax=Luteolibacter algae TaxID=454151 RepID=A0ABW5D846_9BACT
MTVGLSLLPSCVATGYKVRRNVAYAQSDWMQLNEGDLYQPKTSGRKPAILLLHGDGRIGDDGRWQMAGIARRLAQRGYVVFNATYRMAPDWTYPAPLVDARAALRWMRDHADENGIDPNRIGVFGYSAGGYVGMLTAMKGEADVKAVVAGGAPSNLTYYAGGDLIRNFLGGRVEDIPEKYWEASPVNDVGAGSPPVFLYHGEKDTLVSPDHLLEMEDKLVENGVPHEVFWIHGKGHIGAFLSQGKALAAAMEFLDKHLK